MSNAYRTEWFLVVVSGCVVGVFGAALREMAEASAAKHGGQIVWLGSYGITYHCGFRIEC